MSDSALPFGIAELLFGSFLLACSTFFSSSDDISHGRCAFFFFCLRWSTLEIKNSLVMK